MSFENRGGFPTIFRASITTAGQKHQFRSILKFLQVFNVDSTEALRFYFTVEDFTADANFIELVAGGSFEGPIEAKEIWLRGVGGTADCALVEYSRRG